MQEVLLQLPVTIRDFKADRPQSFPELIQASMDALGEMECSDPLRYVCMKR